MAGLQRSSVSFRRQGSSGLVWDDKFLQIELNQRMNQKEEHTAGSPETHKRQQEQEQREGQAKEEVTKGSSATVGSIDRSRSNGGGRGYRTGKVSPAIEPPSPKVSACGFCSGFRKQEKTARRPPKAGKREL